jgi:hypothetical protein
MMPASNFMTPVRRFFTDRAWREEKVAAYASIGLLVFLTSFFWAPTRDFMHVVYGLAFFVPVLFVLLFRQPDFNQYGGCFTGLALLYAGYASISTLWSETPRLEFFAQHFVFLAVWLAGTAWLASRGQLNIERLYRVLIVTGAAGSIVYQIGFHWINYPLDYGGDAGNRLGFVGFGVTRNPNTIGLIFGATTLVAYIWWLQSSGLRQGVLRFGLLTLNGVAVLVSLSRGSIIALAFVLALGFALFRGPSRKWLVHGTMVIGLLGLVAFGSQQEAVVSTIQERVNSKVFRTTIWSHVVHKSWHDHSLHGEGLTKTTRINVPELMDELGPVPHAHNAYIDAFYWTGLTGLLLMCAHMVYVLRHWSNSPRILPLYLWFLFGCLTALVDRPGFFEHLNSHWFGYWIPAGLIGALVMAERQKSSSA